jgi:hypothetical protein
MRQRKFINDEKIKGGQTDINDVCSGLPQTVTCVEVKEQIDQHTQNQRISTNDMTISHEKKPKAQPNTF